MGQAMVAPSGASAAAVTTADAVAQRTSPAGTSPKSSSPATTTPCGAPSPRVAVTPGASTTPRLRTATLSSTVSPGLSTPSPSTTISSGSQWILATSTDISPWYGR